jgi:protein-S-isoprenylcysteine O-methyltransferase Ste14
MLLRDQMAITGARLFRWRSYVLLAFVPALVWATWQGEAVEAAVGEFWGEAFEGFAIALVVLGEAVRILTVGFVPAGTSGRNTTAGQVASRVNTTGAYSLVRNPLYLGNCLMYLGVVLFAQSLGLAVVFCLVLFLYYERIIAAEEAFLAGKFGTDYTDWAARTPVFIPRLTGWCAPDMVFSWKSVIRREHASVYAGIVALFLVEAGLTLLSPDATEAFDTGWFVVLGIATGLELLVIWLKKRTSVLNVAGR